MTARVTPPGDKVGGLGLAWHPLSFGGQGDVSVSLPATSEASGGIRPWGPDSTSECRCGSQPHQPLSPRVLTGPGAARRARRPSVTRATAAAGAGAAAARAGRPSFWGSAPREGAWRGPGRVSGPSLCSQPQPRAPGAMHPAPRPAELGRPGHSLLNLQLALATPMSRPRHALGHAPSRFDCASPWLCPRLTTYHAPPLSGHAPVRPDSAPS
jgi:hypothetical protein